MKVYELLNNLERYPAGAFVRLRVDYGFIKMLVLDAVHEHGTNEDEIGIDLCIDDCPVEVNGNLVILSTRNGSTHWNGKQRSINHDD